MAYYRTNREVGPGKTPASLPPFCVRYLTNGQEAAHGDRTTPALGGCRWLAGVPVVEAISAFLRWLSTKRGPVQAGHLVKDGAVLQVGAAESVDWTGHGRRTGHRSRWAAAAGQRVRIAWGHQAPSTFNAKRAAVASALSYFQREGGLPTDA